MRIEIQIRSTEMHAQAEYGLAAHWAYKQADIAKPDAHVSWIRDLIEILEHAGSAEELLEQTRLAMYQDRIFAFTPTGELIQLPKGATPVDFAYAVHTDLGDQTVGAKINGRVVPLRTPIENGDQVEILRSKAQEPEVSWLNFVTTGKARAAIRRHVRNRERDEQIALGRKFYDEIVRRLPAQLGQEALAAACRRLNLPDAESLMLGIARRTLTDAQVMEALMPGSAGESVVAPSQREAISIRGLTPGVAFTLATCCHPVPGDRIVGLRKPGESVEVHSIDCPHLADGVDADWVDLAWGDGSDGGTARISIVVKNEAGALGVAASILGAHGANIVNLGIVHRDSGFHTYHIAIEVRDVQHLMRIIAALRAAEAVSQVERI
jgi:(p)ppGpp synthase/HD superfamily hydrolase